MPCSFLLLFSSFLLLVDFPKTILFCDNLSVTLEDIFLTLIDASCYTCTCVLPNIFPNTEFFINLRSSKSYFAFVLSSHLCMPSTMLRDWTRLTCGRFLILADCLAAASKCLFVWHSFSYYTDYPQVFRAYQSCFFG